MLVTNNTIIVEDRFEEMFSVLNTVNSFKPVFGCGDEKELVAFLQSRKEDDDPYPLIWLVYPYKEIHTKGKVQLENVNIVLAVTTNKTMLNKQRILDTYKPMLIPLFDNIREVFMRSNIINMEDEYETFKYPNYSGSEDVDSGSNYTIAIWDALKISFNCVINDACFKLERFNN